MLSACVSTNEESTTASSKTTTNQHVNFNGLWQVTEYDEIIRPDETGEFTEEAKQRLQFYKDHFDPKTESGARFCDQPGMPGMMGARARTYPREIYQSDDRIFYMFEYMDIYRVIRFNESSIPENYPGTENGYSLAHWEGDELVIVTEGFTNTAYVDLALRSDKAKVIERWRLIEHPKFGEAIEINLEVIDPEIYTKPAHGRALYMRAEKGTVLGDYNCPGTLWENFVDKRIGEVEAKNKQ